MGRLQLVSSPHFGFLDPSDWDNRVSGSLPRFESERSSIADFPAVCPDENNIRQGPTPQYQSLQDLPPTTSRGFPSPAQPTQDPLRHSGGLAPTPTTVGTGSASRTA